MANKERGEFTLAVGDRTYTLRLTANACAELEDITDGRTLDQVLFGILRRHSIRDVRYLLWAALRDKHPDLATIDKASLSAVGKLIDDAGGFAGVSEQVKAFVELNKDRDPQQTQKGGASAADPPEAGALGGDGSTPMPASSA